MFKFPKLISFSNLYQRIVSRLIFLIKTFAIFKLLKVVKIGKYILNIILFQFFKIVSARDFIRVDGNPPRFIETYVINILYIILM